MIHIKPFQAVQAHLDMVASPEVFFNEVKKNYTQLYKDGFLSRMSREALFFYKYQRPQRAHYGIVAATAIADYVNGHIVRHEHTLAEKEQKMLQSLLQRRALVKPVLLTYPDVPALGDLLRGYADTHAADIHVHYGSDEHFLWAVTDGALIGQVQALFAEQVPAAYIADGHHRCSTAAILCQRLREQNRQHTGTEAYNYIMGAFFAVSELDILDFNRVVAFDEEDLSATRLMALLSQKCHIEPLDVPAPPAAKHELLFLVGREAYRLRWRPEVLARHQDAVAQLDVSLLNHEVLEGIFGIADIRHDSRVDYVEGPRGVEGLRLAMRRPTGAAAAFGLFPVQWPDLQRIADEGEVLPPKSTWFEPRIRNGILNYAW